MSKTELFEPKRLSNEEYLGALQELIDGDLASVEPNAFARLVKRTSDDQLRALERSPLLVEVAAAIFDQMQENFRVGAASPTKSVIRWVIAAPHVEIVYETTVSDEGCTVVAGAGVEKPRATLRLSGVDFLKLSSGNASPPMMVLKRKLKISGDVGFATAVPKLFDIPHA